MGNREDLLDGAIRCLYEKGYARTTLRDIAGAAGVSMAAVGYHYGSTEALLNIALMRAIEEWGAEFGRALGGGEPGSDQPGSDQPGSDQPGSDQPGSALREYESMWDRLIDSVAAHPPMALASFEAFVQAQRVPELREQIAAGQREGRRGLAAMLTGTPEQAVSDDTARTLGAVQLALITGLIVQWLTDPDNAPSGADVVAGLRALAAGLQD
ncbi:TetR family transcriptional regulator [Planobispora rosea]|uniref:TetR family transcriptional regulator n=1 Tax=Planobispora rosea TaxID=35762 RepID=A0A8J3S2Z6_PLARO|nr:TetR/AcrR family transcriptional regulator [Planobispora rosea]GGS81525.1 TetR family transcriptional regulator [Planobispora rosea]GIH86138.1 TetR family transcriptional regulator [Planobispora rosea]